MQLELIRLEPNSIREDFTCNDKDLDEFYKVDSIRGAAQLLSVTYALAENGRTIAFFSLSNDSIKREVAPKAYNKITRKIPNEKRYASLPAAKIGRIGVCAERKGGRNRNANPGLFEIFIHPQK